MYSRRDILNYCQNNSSTQKNPMNTVESIRVYVSNSPSLYLVCLTLSHLIGDWLIQSEYEALNKALGKFLNRALWMHCFKYTLCFVPVIWLAKENLWWLTLVLGSHLIIDRRFPVIWWRLHICHCSPEAIQKTFWITVVVDQVFHFLIIMILFFANVYGQIISHAHWVNSH